LGEREEGKNPLRERKQGARKQQRRKNYIEPGTLWVGQVQERRAFKESEKKKGGRE